jgi:hypothetical protein
MRLDRVMDTTADSLLTAFDYVWDRLGGLAVGGSALLAVIPKRH